MPKALKRYELTRPTRLALFRVAGRAVPWSVSRRGTKNPALVTWQSCVSLAAKMAYGPIPAYEGPVGVSAWFYMRPPSGRGMTPPDLTNLFKGFEDALQKQIICNDKQVFATHPEMIPIDIEDDEFTYGEVWAIPRGEINPTHPGPYAYRPWEWRVALANGSQPD